MDCKNCLIRILENAPQKTYQEKKEILKNAKAIMLKMYNNCNFEKFTINEMDAAKMYVKSQIKDFDKMIEYCENKINEK